MEIRVCSSQKPGIGDLCLESALEKIYSVQFGSGKGKLPGVLMNPVPSFDCKKAGAKREVRENFVQKVLAWCCLPCSTNR